MELPSSQSEKTSQLKKYFLVFAGFVSASHTVAGFAFMVIFFFTMYSFMVNVDWYIFIERAKFDFYLFFERNLKILVNS